MADPIGNDFVLDPMGQAPSLHQIYTHMILCFDVPDPASYPAIVDRVRQGYAGLTKELPWVGGHIIVEGVKPGNSGTYKIQSYDEGTAPDPITVRDLRDDPAVPSMSELRDAHFPMSMMKEEMFGPYKTVLLQVEDDYPVLRVLVNFINGGLLLSFMGGHGAMDGMGQGQLIDLFAKACRGEAFTDEEIAHGNLPRHNLLEPVEDEAVLQSFMTSLVTAGEGNGQVVDERLSEDRPTPPPSQRCTWVNFSFNDESLAALKSLAEKTMTADTTYISTDDAVTAFIWQTFIRCKLSLNNEMRHAKTTMARAVDARRYVGVPKDFAGLCVNVRDRTYSAQQLVLNETVGSIASKLRVDIDPETSDFGLFTRSLATLLGRMTDKSPFNVLDNILKGPLNMNFTSWLKLTCQDADFGPELGQSEALRTPSMAMELDRLVIFLPESAKSGHGGRVAAMCLKSENLEYLRKDAVWAAHAKYLG